MCQSNVQYQLLCCSITLRNLKLASIRWRRKREKDWPSLFVYRYTRSRLFLHPLALFSFAPTFVRLFVFIFYHHNQRRAVFNVKPPPSPHAQLMPDLEPVCLFSHFSRFISFYLFCWVNSGLGLIYTYYLQNLIHSTKKRSRFAIQLSDAPRGFE